jgi:hypothetical protein
MRITQLHTGFERFTDGGAADAELLADGGE